ncbi:hypothetical protein GCM10023091_34470 [Ravibacter arvi]|uniref:3-keto-alpha-glucoside-1,2-lyase/3-keto-2-hydroxy-glucal hydratase domain-containing protein n=1 Tax=Ravibacter arvi TaxID=2051041 RepID=A0ABP8M7K9_9BACT
MMFKPKAWHAVLPFTLVMALSSCDPKPEQKLEIGKTIQLYNGKDFDGWYKYLKSTGKGNDPKNVFSVQNGEVFITGEDYGCITTDDEYENYRLVVEYKWGTKTYEPRVDKARDNGVLIHSTGKDGAFSGSWMYSIECQIIEGGTGDFLVVGDGSENYALTANVANPDKEGAKLYQNGGRPATIHSGRIDWFARSEAWKDTVDFRGKYDLEKPVGEWNTMEVVAFGDKVDIFLNGRLVNQAFNVKPSKGRIQIQSEGAEMYVRKVELTPIDAYEPDYLNTPGLVKAAGDNKLQLDAKTGVGVGPKIKYMPEWDAFGWFTEADYVKWDAEVAKAGKYDVYMDWAVPDNSAGNPYILEANGKDVLKGKVGSTGSWIDFKEEKIGTVTLEAGKQVIAFKPDPSLKEAGMLDLKKLVFVPVP